MLILSPISAICKAIFSGFFASFLYRSRWSGWIVLAYCIGFPCTLEGKRSKQGEQIAEQIASAELKSYLEKNGIDEGAAYHALFNRSQHKLYELLPALITWRHVHKLISDGKKQSLLEGYKRYPSLIQLQLALRDLPTQYRELRSIFLIWGTILTYLFYKTPNKLAYLDLFKVVKPHKPDVDFLYLLILITLCPALTLVVHFQLLESWQRQHAAAQDLQQFWIEIGGNHLYPPAMDPRAAQMLYNTIPQFLATDYIYKRLPKQLFDLGMVVWKKSGHLEGLSHYYQQQVELNNQKIHLQSDAKPPYKAYAILFDYFEQIGLYSFD